MKKKKSPKAGVAECCDITLEAIKIHWKKLLPLLTVLVILQAAANYLSDPMWLLSSLVPTVPQTVRPSEIGRLLFGSLLSMAATCFSIVAAGAVSAFLAFYLTTGGTLRFGRMFKRGIVYMFSGFLVIYMGYAIAVVAVALLVFFFGLVSGSVTVTLWAVLLALPFLLYFLLRLCLCGAMMLAHHRNIFRGLKESWNFTGTRKARTLLAVCVGFLLAGEAGSVLAAATVLNLLGSGVAYRILAALLSSLSVVSGILPTAFLTVFVLREESAAGLSAGEEQLNMFLSERGV